MSLFLQKITAAIFLLCALVGPANAENRLRILTMGDSLMASHKISNRSVSDAIGRYLGVNVSDRSVFGARHLYRLPIYGAMGLNISKQYRRGRWDWIVVNGGGNDLWMGCGCLRCNRKMDKLIARDSKSGEIRSLIAELRQTGARVIYVGYLRSPGSGSPIEHCKDEGDELERRISRLAAADDGVYFLSLADLVPKGDRTYHAVDMIHPSIKASKEIGLRIARMIRR